MKHGDHIVYRRQHVLIIIDFHTHLIILTVADNSACLSVNIHKVKIKVLKVKLSNTVPITLEGQIIRGDGQLHLSWQHHQHAGGTDADEHE